MRRLAVALTILALCAIPLPAFTGLEKILEIPPPRPELKIDFDGEHLKYEASWLGLKAGEAELTVSGLESGYKISAVSRTTGRARYLYKLDDAVFAETLRDFSPVFYDLQIREPAFKHNRLMWIDRRNKIAKVKTVQAASGAVKEKEFEFYQGFDPVGLTFLVRSIDWKPGMIKYFEFLDGRDRSLILLEAGPVQEVKTRAGSFRTIRIQPLLFTLPRRLGKETPELMKQIKNREGVQGLASWVYFWLALDGTRPIVLAKAYSIIGPVALELVEMAGPPAPGQKASPAPGTGK